MHWHAGTFFCTLCTSILLTGSAIGCPPSGFVPTTDFLRATQWIVHTAWSFPTIFSLPLPFQLPTSEYHKPTSRSNILDLTSSTMSAQQEPIVGSEPL
eukprot:5991231-Amphidinium_carterae.1